MRKLFMVPALLLAVSLLFLPGASAGTSPQTVNQSFQLPLHLDLSATSTGCSNSPGPTITLSGDFALEGFGAEFIFRNNWDGTHTYKADSQVSAQLVPAGATMSIPKQPVIGGVGGNPFIWIQLMDERGRALTSEIYLGRCVQGSYKAEADFTLPAIATARMTTSDCSNAPGPYITLDGAMALSGINGKLIFRNNDNPVGGPHQASEGMSTSTVLLPLGHSIQFPKQPVLGGVGGNPWIWLQFEQGDGAEIGAENLMGRCVQMSK